MKLESTQVGILRCRKYHRSSIKGRIDQIFHSLSFKVGLGDQVLLKPNLVSAQGINGLACTHSEFIAAAAEWFLDHGAVVSVGDSPAFGSAEGVMSACGITEALKTLPVRLQNFDRIRQVMLGSGISANISAAALECDLLVNLPKVKAHSQLTVTLAVKNYFGTVVGFSKPWWHLRYGGCDERFSTLLVDLLEVLPPSATMADGITAMHVTGPISGKPFSLGLMAGSINPVALDTALLVILGLKCSQSLLWCECASRRLPGCYPEQISYPLLVPDEVPVDNFMIPKLLKPISFNPFHMLISAIKRLTANMS